MLRIIPALFVTIFLITGLLSMKKKPIHQKEEEAKTPRMQMKKPENLPK
jgi:hypothetical protein